MVIVAVLLMLPSISTATVSCKALPGRSMAYELVDLGNGRYHYVGEIETQDWRLTLIDFRQQHPRLAITAIQVGQRRSGPCYDYVGDITLSTTRSQTRAPRPTTGTVMLLAVPWASVSWQGGEGEASDASPLLVRDLPCGKHQFRFAHPYFESVTRVINVCKQTKPYRIDLTREARTREIFGR